jgi:hypothetical protein
LVLPFNPFRAFPKKKKRGRETLDIFFSLFILLSLSTCSFFHILFFII